LPLVCEEVEGALQLDVRTPDEIRLSKYLLGQSTEDERERTEGEFFADDKVFEQLLVAEDELIDAYARDDLSKDERLRFEETFLASERSQERVQFLRSLRYVVNGIHSTSAPEETERTSRQSLITTLFARSVSLQYAVAAIVLVFVVGVAWLVIERTRMRKELLQLRDERSALNDKLRETERQAETERSKNEELRAQLDGGPTDATQAKGQQADGSTRENESVTDPGKGQTQNSSVLSFVLSAGLVRGGGAKTLSVPTNATSIVLNLNLESDRANSTYRAVIETAGGRQIWRASQVKSSRSGRVITLPAIPAKNLPPGDYVLLLSGVLSTGSVENVADYSFRVLRE
jgi:hypothetical protein